MIDPSFVDITDEELSSLTPYSPTMQELQERIADLEKQLSMKTQQWEFAGASLQKRVAQVEQLEDWLKENFDYIDSDHANTLVEMFDLSITQDYEVTITARFTGIVSVPLGYDIDELENDLSVSLDTHHYGNSDVVFDVSEDGIDIVSTEA